MATVKIISNLGSESRIDLGREKPVDPKADPGSGQHRGYVDLLPGENLVDEKLWALALKNPQVKARMGSRNPKTTLPNGYEQATA